MNVEGSPIKYIKDSQSFRAESISNKNTKDSYIYRIESNDTNKSQKINRNLSPMIPKHKISTKHNNVHFNDESVFALVDNKKILTIRGNSVSTSICSNKKESNKSNVISSSEKILRRDYFNNEIKKCKKNEKKKYKLTWSDQIGKGSLINETKIESLKVYNIIVEDSNNSSCQCGCYIY